MRIMNGSEKKSAKTCDLTIACKIEIHLFS